MENIILIFVIDYVSKAFINIKKKREPFSSPKTLHSNKTRFLNMKRATRLSHKTVHDIKPVSPDYDKQEML